MKNGNNFKKRLAALAAFCLCLLLAGGALADSFGVIFNTDTLNLRTQGSSNSGWLGAYSRGTWLSILGSQNNFYQVRTPDGAAGYMSKNYIDVSGDAYQPRRIAVVTNQNGGAFLNFRQQPNYAARVLGIFYTGVPLGVLREESDGWLCVQINNQTGYVRREYVTVTDTVGSATVATIKTPNNTQINLRRGPGMGYGVVRQFAGDRYVMVLAQGNGWWRVAIDGYAGFMDSQFLTMGLNSAKDVAARNGGGAGGGGYAVVNNARSTQTLNLREYPSTGAKVLGKLVNGVTLWVDEQGTEWSAVTVQETGLTGYVMTRYLRLYNLPASPTRTVSHPNGAYVNLRSAPDLTYGQVAARVPDRARVTVLSPGAEWCRVQYGSYTGYMLTYFLQ